MLVRIMKLNFKPKKIEAFSGNFHQKKKDIRKSSDYRLLELYKDKTNLNIFFTYSYWEKDIKNYRNSNLFKNIWAKTKYYLTTNLLPKILTKP